MIIEGICRHVTPDGRLNLIHIGDQTCPDGSKLPLFNCQMCHGTLSAKTINSLKLTLAAKEVWSKYEKE